MSSIQLVDPVTGKPITGRVDLVVLAGRDADGGVRLAGVTGDAVQVTTGGRAVPQVIPTLTHKTSGADNVVTTSRLTLASDATGDPGLALGQLVIGAFTDFEAKSRALAGEPDVLPIQLGELYVLLLDKAITRLDLAIVANIGNTGSPKYIFAENETDPLNVEPVKIEFSTSVKRVLVGLSKAFGANNTKAIMTCVGYEK